MVARKVLVLLLGWSLPRSRSFLSNHGGAVRSVEPQHIGSLHLITPDCVFFVSVDYDSITAFTRKFQQSSGKFRRFVRCDVHTKIFRRREFFFDGAKLFKKLDRVVAIDSVRKSWKSRLSSRFLSRSKYENSHATFGRIQPIVPRFMRIC